MIVTRKTVTLKDKERLAGRAGAMDFKIETETKAESSACCHFPGLFYRHPEDCTMEEPGSLPDANLERMLQEAGRLAQQMRKHTEASMRNNSSSNVEEREESAFYVGEDKPPVSYVGVLPSSSSLGESLGHDTHTSSPYAHRESLASGSTDGIASAIKAANEMQQALRSLEESQSTVRTSNNHTMGGTATRTIVTPSSQEKASPKSPYPSSPKDTIRWDRVPTPSQNDTDYVPIADYSKKQQDPAVIIVATLLIV